MRAQFGKKQLQEIIMASSKTQPKTREDFNKALKDADDKLVVVDFYAVWCTPCQKIIPVWQALEKEFPDVFFYTVNVDENEETAEHYGITAMPTFILYRNGLKIDQMHGPDGNGLKAIILKHHELD